AGLELDHLAGADIIHECGVGGRAFHILHQRGGDEGRRRARQCLARYCKRGGQNGRAEGVVRHPTISLPLPLRVSTMTGRECHPGCKAAFHARGCLLVTEDGERIPARAAICAPEPGSSGTLPCHVAHVTVTPGKRLERSRVTSSPTIRLGVDIGGTFTDVALEIGERRFTGKILT